MKQDNDTELSSNEHSLAVHELSARTAGMKKLPAEKTREGDIFRKN